MFKFKNTTNATYLAQFLNDDVSFDFSDVRLESFEYYAPFEEEVEKLSMAKRPLVIAELIAEYTPQGPLRQILGKHDCSDNTQASPNQSIPGALKSNFNGMMMELGQKAIKCHLDDEGKVFFNKKAFAECVSKLCNLAINHKDPETLLIYNKCKGYWMDATIPLTRLIIEIAHYVGGNVRDSWNSRLEKEIIDILVRKSGFIQPICFNKGYFPFSNQTLESRTGQLVPHSKSYYATFGSPVVYDPEATCPVFEQFLSEVFNDEATIQFVQEWFGYVLSSEHKANALLIGIGAGANGKSTLADVLAELVGLSNVSSAPLSNFNSEFGLEPLIDMKLNLATESDVDIFKTGKLKALTAGESISVNRKNKKEVTIVLPTKLVFLMNELPMLSDNSLGFERRLILLPFDNTFTPDKQDKDLPKKLKTELSGILNWALSGLMRLIQNNYHFTVSASMDAVKTKYFGIGNPVSQFIDECITAEPANAMESKEVFGAYRTWMMMKGYPYKGTDSLQTFWRLFGEAAALKLLVWKKTKSNGKTLVRDIAIRAEF